MAGILPHPSTRTSLLGDPIDDIDELPRHGFLNVPFKRLVLPRIEGYVTAADGARSRDFEQSVSLGCAVWIGAVETVSPPASADRPGRHDLDMVHIMAAVLVVVAVEAGHVPEGAQ